MAHLFRMSEWECGNGHWYVNDIEEIGTDSSQWWMPMRLLEMTPEQYVYFLKDHFNAKNFHYQEKFDVLIFDFESQGEVRAFKNYMNALARKKNFICGGQKCYPKAKN